MNNITLKIRKINYIEKQADVNQMFDDEPGIFRHG
jgi:hypothetical protein